MTRDDDSRRDPFEELAADFTERCRRGEEPSIEAYAARHPDMAEDIRSLFSMIRDMECAKDALSDSGGVVVSTAVLERVGDVRIIREIGRGGMGVVYEGEQESLGRHVAVKLLPQHYLSSPGRRERFEREARTAARLHHTSIVPIFGTGEQDGCPYFIMQYIRGVSLDAVFRHLFARKHQTPAAASSESRSFHFGRLAAGLLQGYSQDAGQPAPALPPALSPAYWRALAMLLAQAADALAHAHAHGVLHRDIKPGNLLLDEDGNVWVTDFGLAKAAEHQNLTQAEDVVGTLRYMAAEQFAHKSDQRSDVYGLGVTLYELAVLQPAFADAAGSSSMRAVLDHSLWPVRRFCPSIPRDLETIIDKATAREPEHRYASAAELRDDLRRFAEDRPIRARRASITERIWRWSRRNPALATSTAAALLLLVAVAFVASTAYFEGRRANERISQALVGETRQRERAVATADLAVEALDTLFEEFAPESAVVSGEFRLDEAESGTLSVAVPPVLSDETARLLQHMLGFYARLAGQEGDSRELRLKMGAAQRRVGEIQERLGQYAAAKAAYTASIETYRELLGTSAPSDDLRLVLARVHEQLGAVLALEDHPAEAMQEYKAAGEVLSSYPEATRQTPQVRFEQARIHYLMGRAPGGDLPIRELPPPPGPRGRGTEGFQGPGPRGPTPGGPRPEGPGRGLRRWMENSDPPPPRAGFASMRPEPLVLREHLDQAIRILEELTGDAPEVPAYRHLLARCLLERRPAPRGPQQPDGANGDFTRAVDLLEALVTELPDVPQYQYDLCEAYASGPPRPDELNQLQRALGMMDQLIRQRPGIPSYLFCLARVHARLGDVMRAREAHDNALAHLREAVALQSGVADRFPEVTSYRMATALYERDLAQELMAGRQPQQVPELLRSAIARVEPLIGTGEPRMHLRFLVGSCYRELAEALRATGAVEEAREAAQKANQFRGPPTSRPFAPFRADAP